MSWLNQTVANGVPKGRGHRVYGTGPGEPRDPAMRKGSRGLWAEHSQMDVAQKEVPSTPSLPPQLLKISPYSGDIASGRTVAHSLPTVPECHHLRRYPGCPRPRRKQDPIVFTLMVALLVVTIYCCNARRSEDSPNRLAVGGRAAALFSSLSTWSEPTTRPTRARSVTFA